MGFYQFDVKNIAGEEVSLDLFKDQVVLVVNVASACGLTPQYEGLQKLFDSYKDKGFSVLAFPCNQFGAQEPGTDEEIAAFARNRSASADRASLTCWLPR